MQKDWIGNRFFLVSGNNRGDNPAEHDFYSTDPAAVEKLLQRETFNNKVWECACGVGHISEVLKLHGYDVKSSDIIDRGYQNTEIIDFLVSDNKENRDIITNPPYKFAQQFVEHAMDIAHDGFKMAMFLKLTFLEGKARRKMFEQIPPNKVYVFSSRMCCGKTAY